MSAEEDIEAALTILEGHCVTEIPLDAITTIRDCVVELVEELEVAFGAARMALRVKGPLKNLPGMLMKLPGDNAYVFETYADWLKAREESKNEG